MADAEVTEVIASKDQRRVVVELPMGEYSATHPNERIAWFYSHILEKMPECEMRRALTLARQETAERKKVGRDDWGKPLIEDAGKYAFRGFARRSDGKPTEDHPDSTYARTLERIRNEGIDAPCPAMISPNITWDTFTVPVPQDLERGLDISMVLVYKNQPFVYVPDSVEGDAYQVDLNIPNIRERARKVSRKEAQASGLPSLKDNLIGQVEVHWKGKIDRKVVSDTGDAVREGKLATLRRRLRQFIK